MAFAPVWLKETFLLTVAHKRETERSSERKKVLKKRERRQERDRERCLDCKRRGSYHSLQDSNSCSFSYKRKREICEVDEELWGVDEKGVVCKNHGNNVLTDAIHATMTSETLK